MHRPINVKDGMCVIELSAIFFSRFFLPMTWLQLNAKILFKICCLFFVLVCVLAVGICYGSAMCHYHTETARSTSPLVNLCSCCVICCCFRPVPNFRSFSTNIHFMGWDCQPHAQPPTWRTRVSLFVWVITLDLSGMGGPTGSKSYRQHSSQDHVTTQAPLLRQSRDTFGGSKNYTESKYLSLFDVSDIYRDSEKFVDGSEKWYTRIFWFTGQ
jgi:hypothetical protein